MRPLPRSAGYPNSSPVRRRAKRRRGRRQLGRAAAGLGAGDGRKAGDGRIQARRNSPFRAAERGRAQHHKLVLQVAQIAMPQREIQPRFAALSRKPGPRRELTAGDHTVMTLCPLADGDLLVAAQDPYLARLRPDGAVRWQQRPQQADLRGQDETLAISADGQQVDFGYEVWGKAPARFDLTRLMLQIDPPSDGATKPPRQTGLPIIGWKNTFTPTLADAPLALDPYERSRSLAIHPDGQRFVLGTGWSLRAFAADGKPLWRMPTPGVVWAVNITGDGRLVVAALRRRHYPLAPDERRQGAAGLLPPGRPQALGGLDARRLLRRRPRHRRGAGLAGQPWLGPPGRVLPDHQLWRLLPGPGAAAGAAGAGHGAGTRHRQDRLRSPASPGADPQPGPAWGRNCMSSRSGSATMPTRASSSTSRTRTPTTSPLPFWGRKAGSTARSTLST